MVRKDSSMTFGTGKSCDYNFVLQSFTRFPFYSLKLFCLCYRLGDSNRESTIPCLLKDSLVDWTICKWLLSSKSHLRWTNRKRRMTYTWRRDPNLDERPGDSSFD